MISIHTHITHDPKIIREPGLRSVLGCTNLYVFSLSKLLDPVIFIDNMVLIFMEKQSHKLDPTYVIGKWTGKCLRNCNGVTSSAITMGGTENSITHNYQDLLKITEYTQTLNYNKFYFENLLNQNDVSL